MAKPLFSNIQIRLNLIAARSTCKAAYKDWKENGNLNARAELKRAKELFYFWNDLRRNRGIDG